MGVAFVWHNRAVVVIGSKEGISMALGQNRLVHNGISCWHVFVKERIMEECVSDLLSKLHSSAC